MYCRKYKHIFTRLLFGISLLWIGYQFSTFKNNSFNRLHVENQNDLKLYFPVEKEGCETIHIAIVCAGFHANQDLVTHIKSVLSHRKNRLHIHLIVNSLSKKVLGTLFRTWNIPHFMISFYNVEDYESDVSWIPNTHYSGVFGLVKLVIPKILPLNLEKVIVMDTDIIVTDDIADIWNTFQLFGKNEAIGLVENHSDWYLGTLYRNYTYWPALGRGFNTGVMLLALHKLRAIGWENIWVNEAKLNIKVLKSVALADQDIFNSVIKENPKLIFQLPCYWNLQLSDNMKTELCYANNKHTIKAIHWNFRKSRKTQYKHAKMFSHLKIKHIETNGAFFRKAFIECELFEENDSTQQYIDDDDDQCSEFTLNSAILHRTHLYFLPFSYEPINNDVSIVVHLSIDRLQMLEILCRQWDGPISASVFLTDSAVSRFELFVDSSTVLSVRQNIAFHLVFQSSVEDVYPINLLRNVALQQAVTDFVFLYDVDFVPMPGLYSYILSYLSYSMHTNLTAFIVPAFESLWYKNEMPTSKSELLSQIQSGGITTFREKVWPQGHAATNFTKWKLMYRPYQINWEKDFEPYVILSRKKCPFYDKRFVGFGWNKISHIMELDAIGFNFIVLPHGFITHIPHLPSMELQKYRTLSQYRECMNNLKISFIENLVQKYQLQQNKYTELIEEY